MRVALYLIWGGVNLIVIFLENEIFFTLYMISFAAVSLCFFKKKETFVNVINYMFIIAVPMALSLQKFKEMGEWVNYVYLFFASIPIAVHYKKPAQK